MWSTAALVTLYQPMFGSTPRPPTEATLITEPRRPARTAAPVQTSTESWFTSNVFWARTTSMSIIGPKYGLVPALLTRMSRPPKRATVSATHDRASSGLPTWAAVQATRSSGAPAATSPAAASARSSAVRDVIITFAPASTNREAMPRPMPRLPPVMSAVFPLSSSSIARALHGCRRCAASAAEAP